MKGQVSLETLLILLIQIASVVLLVSVFFTFFNASEQLVKKYNMLKEKHWAKSVVEEVCVLGNGQIRTISLKYNHTIETKCGTVNLPSGTVTIKNQLGTIVLS